MNSLLKKISVAVFMFLLTSQGLSEVDSTRSVSTYSPAFANINPVGLFYGTFSGEVGVGFQEHWNVGVLGAYTDYRENHDNFDGSNFGIVGYYYFKNSVVSTPFLKLTAERGFLNVETQDYSEGSKGGSAFVNYGAVKILGGYHFVLFNGINLNLGGGFTYLTTNTRKKGNPNIKIGDLRSSIPSYDFSGFIPNAEFTAGIALTI